MLERQFGEVSEWLKEHAWKVCIRQRIGGSNPPLTAIFKKELVRKYGLFAYMYPPNQGGMRTTDRGSTTGAASWTDDEPARRLPAGRAQRVNPPSPPYSRKSSYESTGFFFALRHRLLPDGAAGASSGTTVQPDLISATSSNNNTTIRAYIF